MIEIDYDLYAREYDVMCEYNPEYQKLIQTIKNDITQLNTKNVAEFGSGTGNILINSIFPNSHNSQIYSIDNNQTFLDIQRQKLTSLGLEDKITLLCEDLREGTTLKDESLNLGVMIHCINLIDKNKREKVLEHVYQKIKPSGHLLIADINQPINVNFWLSEVLIPEAYRRGGEKEVKYFMNKTKYAKKINEQVQGLQKQGLVWTPGLNELCDLLEKTGFSIIRKDNTQYANTDNYIIAQKYN
jgi:ubiquinone/menaquinone biosynthesis C-methylase UbiE